jgi:hypothetical protein
MPFDPTLPVNSSQISSAELRAQLNALNTLITVNAAGDATALQTAIEGTASNPTDVTTLSQTISNPPTQAQVLAIQNKLNELIGALQRFTP